METEFLHSEGNGLLLWLHRLFMNQALSTLIYVSMEEEGFID